MPRYSFPALIELTNDVPAGDNRTGNNVRCKAGTGTDDDDEHHADPFLTPLEKNFPHILEKIQALWGYPEMNYYFLRLTIDERGDREGFPTEVWDDLQILVRIHHDLFPDRPV